MATIIKTDGTVKSFEIIKGKSKLQTLQHIVGGYIEGHHTINGKFMYMNEEGRIKSLPLNQRATAIYGFGEIYGDVILFNAGEET